MPLTQKDAVRILRFCLAADDSGTAAVRDDGACTVTIALCRSSYEVRTFEGASFEEALRGAGRGGALKLACVDKQIAFVARRAPTDDVAPTPAPDAATPPAAPADSPFLAFTSAVGTLMHETQRERGVSTLFVASHGRRFGDELQRQRARVDAQRASLAALAHTKPELPPSVSLRLDRAHTLLAQLAQNRAGVEDLVMSASQVISFFSAVNVELLAALDAFMVMGLGGPARAGALACVALLYAKEKTGVERAQLTDAFFEDRFSDGQRLSVAAAIAAQASYLHIFSAAAPRAAEQLLRRTLASPEAEEVKRMESVVYGAGEAGFGIDAAAWFAAISRKIDMLDEVSSSVISMLRDAR
ncbi:MAG TPA: nitrate- and nitrite sensing domain-containing protein [Polyangia bacterium]|nr:nitrate- and nitrite sensing domain-containing protein [Polyangia bacterium]